MELETYVQNLFRRFPEVLLCLGRSDLEECFEVQRQAISITDTDTAKVVHIVLPRKGWDAQGRKLHGELDEREAATPTSQLSNRGRPPGNKASSEMQGGYVSHPQPNRPPGQDIGTSHMSSSDEMQSGYRWPLQLQHDARPPTLGANLGISRPSSDKGSRPSSGKSLQPSSERLQLGSPRDQAGSERQPTPISVAGASSAVETWRKLRKEGKGLKPSSLASGRGFVIPRVATVAAMGNKGLPESKADSRESTQPLPEEAVQSPQEEADSEAAGSLQVGRTLASASSASGANSSGTQATMPSLRNMFGGEPQGPRT
mmetsp:Transcript_129642/g.276534  ORF Transcript_129642/g.276534 Transcript_129642/m.276534 type:complete len:315 (-) Transcript_129642:99-1043(-)